MEGTGFGPGDDGRPSNGSPSMDPREFKAGSWGAARFFAEVRIAGRMALLNISQRSRDQRTFSIFAIVGRRSVDLAASILAVRKRITPLILQTLTFRKSSNSL